MGWNGQKVWMGLMGKMGHMDQFHQISKKGQKGQICCICREISKNSRIGKADH